MKTIANGVRILVVDDLPLNQELACAILRRAGHSVDTASNGIEAVAAAEANPYDVILMDIRMPLMDGVSAARKIRGLPGPAGQTPIVAMTADALPEQVRAFGRAGMDGYVAKPYQQQELLFAASSSLRLGARSGKGARGAGRLLQLVRSFYPGR